MIHRFHRGPLSFGDEIRIVYWRQAVRVTRALVHARTTSSRVLAPVRGYLWVPAVALLSGILIGLLLTIA